MFDKRSFLVEIGTEELPPKSLYSLSEAFAENFKKLLLERSLSFTSVKSFATPRRLAVLVNDLDTHEPDQIVVRRGPSIPTAYDDHGCPTQAAIGFAKSCGISIDQLEQFNTTKGSWLSARSIKSGQPVTTLLPALVERALTELPVQKRMRWGNGSAEFVRPIHWVVLLFGTESITARIMGVLSGRNTYGHRYHHPKAIHLVSADTYAETLRTHGYVEPGFGERRADIARQVERIAAQEGGRVYLNPDLLDEVTSLCEWPVALVGRFDERFLIIPSEVLIETMQSHQKYFPIFSNSGALLPRFITICNIQSRDPVQVRLGNERVVRPRFTDAAFFWEQDIKNPLDTLCPGLHGIIFQDQLGSVSDKITRVSALVRFIANKIGLDPELAIRAAHLSKADLLSHMVAEFPSLQGVMGRYYAEYAGENPSVTAAIYEHYLPRKAGDDLPHTPCGQALAIADRLDTLVGIFSIGQRPTGVKDPFALRRAAIGVLRILIETPLPLDLSELLELAQITIGERLATSNIAKDVFDYMIDRLVGYYQEQNYPPDTVDAVLSLGITIPSDIDARIHAVSFFRNLPEAESLTATSKRIRNLLRRSNDLIGEHFDVSFFTEPAEYNLADSLHQTITETTPLIRTGSYIPALTMLSSLKHPVDTFFDNVMVMVDDTSVRINRLSLLKNVDNLFLKIADISRLQ